jgi:hypothetical protein
VLDGHHNTTILIPVVDMCQFLERAVCRKLGVERMIAHCIHVPYTMKQVFALMEYRGDLTMLDYSQALDGSSVLDHETLQTETNAEDGTQLMVRKCPEGLDKADVLLDLRRSWTRANDDCGKGRKVREDGV